MLQVEALGVRYGRTDVLTGIDLGFPAGTVTALIGPNGTGKSSLLRAIAGLQPHAGTVRLAGEVLPARARGATVAYMPQETGAAASLTLLEVVLLGRLGSLALSVPDAVVAEASDILDRFGLRGLHHRTLDQVSGGQRQLAFLAQALFRAPGVLLLDEPTAALDLRHQLIVLERVRDYARRHQVVAIAAMHDLTLAAGFSDRITCLNGGTVAGDGSPEDVLREDLIRSVYGVQASITSHAAGSVSVVPVRATGSDVDDIASHGRSFPAAR